MFLTGVLFAALALVVLAQTRVARLKQTERDLMVKLRNTTAELEAAQAEIARLSTIDPLTDVANYVSRIQAVTGPDLQRAAQRYIQPDKFAVVIVGDRAKIEAGLKTLNLGPLRIVLIDDVFGK